MEQARREHTVRRRRRFVGRPGGGNEVVVVEDARPRAAPMADSMDLLRRWIAKHLPQPLALDNAVRPRPWCGCGGRGKVERAFSWLEENVVFGGRRQRRRRHP